MKSSQEAMIGEAQNAAQNTGGPRSRTRSEKIQTTLLGQVDGAIVCPRKTSFCINFPRSCKDPVGYLYEILHARGLASPEQLRAIFPHPKEPCVVSVWDHARLPLNENEILYNALVLGLCTATVYDPARPVVWTQASLRRRLALYDTAGFYALD